MVILVADIDRPILPDVIAELNDSRALLVECKGADRPDNADSREKRNIGARFAEVSDGRVLFWWVEDATSSKLTSELNALVAS